ncbi:MAG: hypothetical protein COS85_04220 [Armatimonadetes bacterium CG07_land_8_20_14_0_80_59_28]|nr:MAG: hypothetical protein COS85_04220 [Armatimonadetes bacterium CG07_land_8_20_14_0_80_59_28]
MVMAACSPLQILQFATSRETRNRLPACSASRGIQRTHRVREEHLRAVLRSSILGKVEDYWFVLQSVRGPLNDGISRPRQEDKRL